MALTGIDIRRWDLRTLLAAYEATLRQGAKDDADWRRMRDRLYREPDDVRAARRVEGRAAPTSSGAMSLEAVEAMLNAMNARDAAYGAA